MRLLFIIVILFSLAFAYNAIDDSCLAGCCAKYNGMLGELDNSQVPTCLNSAGCMIVYNGATKGNVDVACLKLSYPNTQTPYDKGAIGSCIAATCGSTYTPTSPSPFNDGTEVPLPPFPPCADKLGEIYQISGESILIRQGKEKKIAVGDTFCDDDTVRAGSYAKVYIRFSDGNVRFVGNMATLHIKSDPEWRMNEVDGYVEAKTIQNAVDVFKRLISTGDERTYYDTITGGRWAEPIYRPHSTVIFDFGPSSEKVTVIEGSVDVIELPTEETRTIAAGEQYERLNQQRVSEGTITQAGNVSSELANSGSCCGSAFILGLVGMLFIRHNFTSRKPLA
ncbi:MAG: hypothetical protein V1492_05135 [Candidatus Micrarchaeota archaeon]